METKQISKPKYNKGIKLYEFHKKQGAIKMHLVNSDLRRAGFSDEEIKSFWQSSSELRSVYTVMEVEERRLNAEWEYSMMTGRAFIPSHPETNFGIID